MTAPYASARDRGDEIIQTLLTYSKHELNISDVKLSKRSGIARSTISNLRSGVHHPNLGQFLAICEALYVEPADAINLTPAGAPPPRIRIGNHTYTLSKES